MAQCFLQIDDLTKSFGDLVLFEHISLGINEGDRVGLIAKNGNGKTTLLNIIAGIEGMDSGSVVKCNGLRVSYLSQDPQFPPHISVGELCRCHREGNEWKIDPQKSTTALLDNTSTLTRILTKLKITDFSQPIGQLSGGQRKRIALAHVLAEEPQMLILDEPTNHLDLEMVEWLEGYLNHMRVTLLMVTHDRYFLDRVCNRIVELDNRQLYTYKGNYAYYLEKRQERISVMNANIDRANNLLRKELDWMRRQPQARGHKSRSRKEAFYELEERARRHREQMQVRLATKSSYIGSKIFDAKGVCKTFVSDTPGQPDRVILRDYNYTFARYEKMGIVGNNGVGKSTFLKLLLGLERPDKGHIDIGETVRFGYYSQEGLRFDENQKVIDVVRDIAEVVLMSDGSKLTASQFLQNFLFTPEKQHSYVYKLSGGERRRLYLCTVLMRSPNFLVLDEPTNDLDIVTLNVLEEYLQAFSGCVIVVSHDRYFMDKVVDHLLVFHGGGELQDYPGNYSDYREWRELKDAEAQEASGTANGTRQARETDGAISGQPGRNKPRTAKPARLTFAERREFEELEKLLPQLEEEKRTIEQAMSSGTLSSGDLVEKGLRMTRLLAEIDEMEMRWLELSEKA